MSTCEEVQDEQPSTSGSQVRRSVTDGYTDSIIYVRQELEDLVTSSPLKSEGHNEDSNSDLLEVSVRSFSPSK